MQDLTLSRRIKCFKYLVYSYIVLLLVSGAAQLIIGISLLWENLSYYGILQNNLFVPSIILLSLGPLTLLLCWLGCQATNQKKRCLLGMFTSLLLACICVQFIICGWAISLRESLPNSVELFVDDSFVEFLDKFSRTKVDNLDLWNRMQSQLQCCGVDGPLDYRRLSLPWSCCSRARNAYESICDTHYKRGCLAVLADQIKFRLMFTSISAGIIALSQSVGLFCTIHLTILFGKQTNDFNLYRIKKTKDVPISLQDKRPVLPSPLSMSPSAPGHRLLKTTPLHPAAQAK